jgi:hypothetical protein
MTNPYVTHKGIKHNQITVNLKSGTAERAVWNN